MFRRSLFRLPPRNVGLFRNLSISSPRQAYIRFGHVEPPKRPQRNWDPRVRGVVIAAGVGTVYYLANLEQVPDTGRWRFMNIPVTFEAKFNELVRNQTREELKDATLPPDHPLSRHVRRVASRILHASNLGILRGEETPTFLSPFGMGSDAEGHSWNPDAEFGAAKNPGPVYGPSKEWDVIVVNAKEVINAMASPGVVVVFTGILPVCQDEEGLAAVLSHGNWICCSRLSYFPVARHSAERLASQTISWGIIALLSVLGVDLGLSNFFQKILLELPNSRTQEREADLIGLRLMSRACYNPEASPQMFSRLGRLEAKMGKSSVDFFQTHPSSESRVKFLEENLPEAYAILGSNPDCELVRQQLESFRGTARAVRANDQGGFEFS
ncbi:hypothetical protein GALMADRAFT_74786 [Galerina marginata CBS 339.88]|uniref:Peptidase M48 domain-containing protein n=1 Tax=Galerina marginata (strain CBS 339.88) TaxID=685588 RepID=A0A067SLQ0_GALM3|nr:hypothetical protein GALMADRAFT_74786 [Galerina marginata CBS 339.88]